MVSMPTAPPRRDRHDSRTPDASRGTVPERLSRDSPSAEEQRDRLTGLRNRLGWQEAIAGVSAERAEAPTPASVIDLEIDWLALPRSVREPGVVEELLRTVTGLLRKAFRDSDVLARLDGGEFAVLLPGADESACERIVMRLRDAFARAASVHALSIPVALGSATANETETLTKAYRWAVLRMYEDGVASAAAA